MRSPPCRVFFSKQHFTRGPAQSYPGASPRVLQVKCILVLNSDHDPCQVAKPLSDPGLREQGSDPPRRQRGSNPPRRQRAATHPEGNGAANPQKSPREVLHAHDEASYPGSPPRIPAQIHPGNSLREPQVKFVPFQFELYFNPPLSLAAMRGILTRVAVQSTPRPSVWPVRNGA